MVALFDAVGAGQWMRYFVGASEVTGAILLVLPYTHAVCLGALLLCIVMIGAIIVDSLILKRKPYLSVVFLILMAAIAWIKVSEVG